MKYLKIKKFQIEMAHLDQDQLQLTRIYARVLLAESSPLW